MPKIRTTGCKQVHRDKNCPDCRRGHVCGNSEADVVMMRSLSHTTCRPKSNSAGGNSARS